MTRNDLRAWLLTSLRDDQAPDWLIVLVLEDFGFHWDPLRPNLQPNPFGNPALEESIEGDLWRLRRQQKIESLIYKTYR